MNTITRKVVRRKPQCSVEQGPESISPLLERIFSARDMAGNSLDLSLKNLPTPDLLPDIGEASNLIADAIEKQQRILIVGDYDADGATSTALSIEALSALGATKGSVDYLIPDRVKMGYGLSPNIVKLAMEKQPHLIITVDNGIASVDGVAAAKQTGVKVVITDHHLPGKQLPNADVIVNPNCEGSQFQTKALAGVGVIFYVMVAVRAELVRRQWFERRSVSPPSMLTLCDLVALGTVADVVPLDYTNRILVEAGLRIIRQGKSRMGIQALFDVAQKSANRAVSSDLGFAIGPRINAAGRLQHMSLGVECLLSKDSVKARDLAIQLDAINLKRRETESVMQEQAMSLLSQMDLPNNKQSPVALCLHQADWHEGVIGLLASRLKQKYLCPVLVFADGEDGQLKGSARSIAGVHMRDVLDSIATETPGLVTKFGGHAMAAGLSLSAKDFHLFKDRFLHHVEQAIAEGNICHDILSDGELSAHELNVSTAQEIRYASPWGQGFPEPIFDGEFECVSRRVLQGKHLKMQLRLSSGNALEAIDAIMFNAGAHVEAAIHHGQRIHLVYRLDENVFRNNSSAQLLVEQMRFI